MVDPVATGARLSGMRYRPYEIEPRLAVTDDGPPDFEAMLRPTTAIERLPAKWSCARCGRSARAKHHHDCAHDGSENPIHPTLPAKWRWAGENPLCDQCPRHRRSVPAGPRVAPRIN